MEPVKPCLDSSPDTYHIYYVLPIEAWKANYNFEFDSKNAKDKNGKVSIDYVPYHQIHFAVLERHPDLIFSICELQSVGDEDEVTYMILCNFYHQPSGNYTPTVRYPVMQMGAGRHGAIKNPDARQISDALKRAFCYAAAMQLGLGFSQWALLERDPEDTEAEPKATKRRKQKDENAWEDLDLNAGFDSDDEDDDDDDEDEEDDDEVEQRPARRTRTTRTTRTARATRGGRSRG